MLSDRERRALEDLERCYEVDASEPDRPGRVFPRRPNRPPGFWVLLPLACVCVGLVLTGAPAAGFACALATAIGWLFWRLCCHRAVGVGIFRTAPHDGRPDGSGSRPGESIRQYLKWLAEAD